MDLPNLPLVSACIITYNQEKYISQALEGALMQKGEFSYEIVIGEDNSTDNTRKIIQEYKKKFPNVIRLLLNQKNLGMSKNWVNTISSCKGKYIAICEGDDYWIDPFKLQKQVDFLESNLNYSICFHDVESVYEGIEIAFDTPKIIPKETTTIDDLAKGNFIQTPSCVFRNNLFVEFPDWFYTLKVSDYPLHLLNAQFGEIKYLDEIMGAYRIHGAGVWGHRNQLDMFINWVEVQEGLIGKFSEGTNEILVESQAGLLYKLFQHFENQGDSEKASTYLNRIMKRSPDFMYKRHVQALQYQKALLDSKSYKLGHLLLEPFRTFKKKISVIR